MMDFIRSWKFMAIIIGIFTAIVIALIIVGITQHTEAGFATASTPIEDGFVPPDYPNRPIGICVQSYPLLGVTAPEDLGAVDEAAHIINQRVGFDLLEVGDIHTYTGGCMMVATIGAPVEVSSDPHRHADSGGGSGVCHDSCCFGTWNTGTSELTSLAIQHEIGHCLGLAHDDYEMSIMYPRQHNTPAGTYPPRISDSDRDILRQRYMEAP